MANMNSTIYRRYSHSYAKPLQCQRSCSQCMLPAQTKRPSCYQTMRSVPRPRVPSCCDPRATHYGQQASKLDQVTRGRRLARRYLDVHGFDAVLCVFSPLPAWNPRKLDSLHYLPNSQGVDLPALDRIPSQRHQMRESAAGSRRASQVG